VIKLYSIGEYNMKQRYAVEKDLYKRKISAQLQTPVTGLIKQRCTLKMAVFWVVAPCSLVEVYGRFNRPDDGGSSHL
jgi:hypothetical protein